MRDEGWWWDRERDGGMAKGRGRGDGERDGGMPMERGVEIEGWDGEEKEREMSTSIFLIMA